MELPNPESCWVDAKQQTNSVELTSEPLLPNLE